MGERVCHVTDPVYPDAKTSTSFRDGLEFQDFAIIQLARRGLWVQCFSSKKYQRLGEGPQGVEFKLDRRCSETGRLSIEIAEKSRADMPEWTASGIWRTDNTWLYAQGNETIIFVFARNWLRRWAKGRTVEENSPTIRSNFLPFADARVGAALVIEP